MHDDQIAHVTLPIFAVAENSQKVKYLKLWYSSRPVPPVATGYKLSVVPGLISVHVLQV